MKKLFLYVGLIILIGAGCQPMYKSSSGIKTPASLSIPTLNSVSSSTVTTSKHYQNTEHGFSLQYPSNLKFEEVSAKDIGIEHYLAVRLTQDNGDQMQIYVNPGAHGAGPCFNPDDLSAPVTKISRKIGGIPVKGESCVNNSAEYFSFMHNNEEFEIILTSFFDPKNQAIFQQILSTFKFIR